MEEIQISNYQKSTSSEFLIKTLNYQDSSWEGSIEHIKTGKTIPVRGYLEITFLIQEKLEVQGFPQSATEMRSWEKETIPRYRCSSSHNNNSDKRSEEKMKHRNKKTPAPSGGPTFFVRIHYRQNASWQGSIQWLEGNSTRFFRSHLEMIMLMQEAMEKTGSVEADCEFQSWDNQEEVYS